MAVEARAKAHRSHNKNTIVESTIKPPGRRAPCSMRACTETRGDRCSTEAAPRLSRCTAPYLSPLCVALTTHAGQQNITNSVANTKKTGKKNAGYKTAQ